MSGGTPSGSYGAPQQQQGSGFGKKAEITIYFYISLSY